MTTAQITREERQASTTDATPRRHAWVIRDGNTIVSELTVDAVTGEILNVDTDEDYQDRGYATALYRRASIELGGRIFHAPPTHRFDDGNRFAARVGGPEMPACSTCCAHLHEDHNDYQEG
ncbi:MULTISPECIES: GNAT family N-acetyltransferase [unclassified Frankia]|uniref:GNAT family N-acetyltransferase n=1 Tax=unclassified Frankia TaxID=2632575 RepID=UPI001EF7402D|nr:MULTISPECIES: GNAT family N-acetyltransferase [unclassified Frankia]